MSTAKRGLSLAVVAAFALTLAACGTQSTTTTPTPDTAETIQNSAEEHELVLSDDGISLDRITISEEDPGDVTVSHDIVYYEAGQGSDYGEGGADDEHGADEAAAHTVVTIRTAGTYRVSGTLSQGQLAVDLGEEAKDDPEAVVTLILDGVSVTCTVAPALIFYNVYECSSADEETASWEVDTSAAGANVIIADGSENNFTGSYVARIYEEGTTDKLHKYDGAFYSKMSMNISGETHGDGVLNIVGENEGLDTEMHLTINGGVINIESGNDGINANEDNVSVTTINGGTVNINAGLGSEGDGIDSNGWLVINGGYVFASANSTSGDSGMDATLDIVINGGTAIGTGSMLDAISEESQQQYLALRVDAAAVSEDSEVELTDAEGSVLFSFTAPKAAQCLLLSSEDLSSDGDYTLIVNGEVCQTSDESAGAPPDMGRGNMQMMEIPSGLEEWLSTATDVPDEIRTWLEGLIEQQNNAPGGPGGEMPMEPGQELPQEPNI